MRLTERRREPMPQGGDVYRKQRLMNCNEEYADGSWLINGSNR